MGKTKSHNDIIIVADAPEYNNIMLNVKQPGALCQYYRMNIGKEKSTVIQRVTHRSELNNKEISSFTLKYLQDIDSFVNLTIDIVRKGFLRIIYWKKMNSLTSAAFL